MATPRLSPVADTMVRWRTARSPPPPTPGQLRPCPGLPSIEPEFSVVLRRAGYRQTRPVRAHRKPSPTRKPPHSKSSSAALTRSLAAPPIQWDDDALSLHHARTRLTVHRTAGLKRGTTLLFQTVSPPSSPFTPPTFPKRRDPTSAKPVLVVEIRRGSVKVAVTSRHCFPSSPSLCKPLSTLNLMRPLLICRLARL
jgi:hypothetical protein